MVARSIVDKERNYIFPKKITQLPKPPEYDFCRTGSLRRYRAHRVNSFTDNGSKKCDVLRFFQRQVVSGIPKIRSHTDCTPKKEGTRQSENFSKLPDHLQRGHEAVPVLIEKPQIVRPQKFP
ncbi:hypothetical protein AVEN_238593-1 [Araneus ventricosus]|uniref:Uncharacterized protein n=1 Tax=Araneus ventricosus TaxID=182803 RepID=A0A4Y2GLU5_ARAVE|nr:hypothetical protein AVEN_238593-1 [Araneus ventricosus]